MNKSVPLTTFKYVFSKIFMDFTENGIIGQNTIIIVWG